MFKRLLSRNLDWRGEVEWVLQGTFIWFLREPVYAVETLVASGRVRAVGLWVGTFGVAAGLLVLGIFTTAILDLRWSVWGANGFSGAEPTVIGNSTVLHELFPFGWWRLLAEACIIAELWVLSNGLQQTETFLLRTLVLDVVFRNYELLIFASVRIGIRLYWMVGNGLFA